MQPLTTQLTVVFFVTGSLNMHYIQRIWCVFMAGMSGRPFFILLWLTDECMSSGTYTKPLIYTTNFKVPLLIHIVVCSTGK